MQDFIFGKLATLEQRIAVTQDKKLGVRHGHQIMPLAPQAGDEPLVTVITGLNKRIDKILCEVTEPSPATFTMQLVKTDWDTLNWQYYQTWHVFLPSHEDGTIVRFRIFAFPADGSQPIAADEGAAFSYLVGDPAQPAWAEEAIIYQIFPDRFCPGTGRGWPEDRQLDEVYGGTIQGIIDKLDYLEDLGINCLWLNPFFPDASYHGYHAEDYFSVNPRLGTADDIRQLVDKAHQRNIRILLDFVANHWGSKHPTFQEAQQDRASQYHGWYTWNEWPDDYKTFFTVKDLPQINVANPEAREHLLTAACYWLEEFDFDGFRLDYALGPSHDFWVDFKKAVQQAKPDAWIFGEMTDTPEVQLSYWGRMHGSLDFILLQVLRQTFALGTMDLEELDSFLEKHEAYFPSGYSRPSFLDNHDMDRFLWLAGGNKNRLKLAALCQFTLAGQPTIYYGTEIGLSQSNSMVAPNGLHNMAQARLPMPWGDDQDSDLHAYYRWLIHFRRQHPVLWHGDRKTLHLDNAAGTYVYSRSEPGQEIVVALNLSDQDRSISVRGLNFELKQLAGDVRIIHGS